MARGAGRGRLFDNFKYYHQKRAIIRGKRLIEGRLLFEEIRYSCSDRPSFPSPRSGSFVLITTLSLSFVRSLFVN